MVTGCGPIGGLQECYREGVSCGLRKKREIPFQGSAEGVVLLLGAGLWFLKT
jgi:hypothetical protein